MLQKQILPCLVALCLLLAGILTACHPEALQTGTDRSSQSALSTDVVTSGSTTASVTSKQKSTTSKSETTSKSKTTSKAKTPLASSKVQQPVSVQDSEPVVKNETIQILPNAPAVYTSVPESEYHYAKRLTGTLKTAYNALKNAVATYSIGMIDLGNINADQARMIFMAVRNDHPEYFWIPSCYYTDDSVPGHFKLGMQVDRKTDPKQTVTYLCTDAKRKELSQKLSQVLQTVTDKIQERSKSGALHAFELECIIHDEICERTVYDDQAASDPNSNPFAFTAYGALVEGKAVCEGYARAAQLLLNFFGVPSTLVIGTELSGGAHMWNLVQISGEWYHLDVTWDDGDDAYYHYYFNLPDRVIERDHTIATSITPPAIPDDFSNYMLPTCTGETWRYITQTSTKINAVADLQNALLTGISIAIEQMETDTNRLVCEFGFAAACTPPTNLLNTVNAAIDDAFQSTVSKAFRKKGLTYMGVSLSCPDTPNGGFTVTCRFAKR